MRRIMLGVALAAAPAVAQVSFCERLAVPAGMAPERSKAGATPALWSTRVLNVAQRFLVGGQAMVSMAMAPGDGAGAADYQRLGKACAAQGKVLGCNVEGPGELQLNLNGKEAHVAARPGERARVEMIGTRVTCRNLAAVQAASS